MAAKQRVMKLPVASQAEMLGLTSSPSHSCRAQQGALPHCKTPALAVTSSRLHHFVYKVVVWSRYKQQSWCRWPWFAAKRPAGCTRGWSAPLAVPQPLQATACVNVLPLACLDKADKFGKIVLTIFVACRSDVAAAKSKTADKRRDTGDWSSPGLAAPVDDAAPRLVHPASAGLCPGPFAYFQRRYYPLFCGLGRVSRLVSAHTLRTCMAVPVVLGYA